MKILLNAIFTTFTFFSSINAQSDPQDKNLIVPKNQIKLDVSTTEVPEYLSKSQMESIITLQLRRNDIPYLKSSERESAITGDYPYLLVRVTTSELDVGTYGEITVAFKRFNVFQLSTSQEYDKNFRIKDLKNKDGRGPFNDVTAWSSHAIFFIPERYDESEEIKKYVQRFIDEFSAKYIDANNL